jgi:hypothetical protein
MIVVPWSYGGTEYSCKKKVREWRRENAGTIEYLDNLDSQGLNDMVHDVFDVLRTRFRACIRYQNEVKGMVEAVKQKYKRAQDKKKPTAKHEFIQWTTSSNFMVHQRVHNAESKQDIVCNGFFGEAELKALVPTSEINWRKMKTKTPPNLVHSYDAALVHLVSTGKIGSTWQSGAIEGVEHGESQGLTFMDREEVEWECSPLVSVHDSFSTVASESEKLVTGLRRLFDYSYIVNLPFGRFCKEVTGKTFHRKPSGTHLRKPVVDDASPEKRPFA